MPGKMINDDNNHFSTGEKTQKLPLYTYVPGVTRHPESDQREGEKQTSPAPLRLALDQGQVLFDHGFYWEAHEAWEQGWISAGRTGEVANLMKGLIKLAACGVKCLEQNRAGAIRHATRAVQLFTELMDSPTAVEALKRDRLSPPLAALISFAEKHRADPPIVTPQQRESARYGGVLLLGELPVETKNPAES